VPELRNAGVLQCSLCFNTTTVLPPANRVMDERAQERPAYYRAGGRTLTLPVPAPRISLLSTL
jgi:hypothetical protein